MTTACGKIESATQPNAGRFLLQSADAPPIENYWAKRPVLSADLRPAGCVAASADNTGRFAMTAGDGKPCKRCGTSEWYDDSTCKECKRRAGKRWRENNPGKERAAQRKYREKNPEKVRAAKRNWREKNPEKARAKIRRYRARKNNAPGDGVTAKQWKRILKRYGNKCLRCGTKEDITMDHVVPLVRGGAHDPSNVQPLCFNCNSGKRDKIRDYRKKGIAKWWRQLKLFKRGES